MIDISSLDWQKDPAGLLPAIVQDAETGQVLMLGYMNAEALEQTVKTGLVTFYSRSKKRLWQKGEESGNSLKLVSVVADCDVDALLIKAIPQGPTCHNGSRSCFGDEAELPLETIGLLIRTISERASNPSEKSYTCELLQGGVEKCGAKVLEEAEEVVRAAKSEGKQRTIEEAADLLYHLLVLLKEEGIKFQDLMAEIRKRRK